MDGVRMLFGWSKVSCQVRRTSGEILADGPEAGLESKSDATRSKLAATKSKPGATKSKLAATKSKFLFLSFQWVNLI
jgi:hypothetical protein